MPETREMLDKQWARQQNILNSSREQKKKAKNAKKGLQSSKKWLSKHSLAAKKLTILDALAPTFIPHKGTYVPILNKQVMSKVFDDILPIAHTSKGSKRRMNIVNPQGVDLDAYQKKVEAARETYVTRLNKIVWQAIPEDEKEQFESDVPISYQENRVQLEEVLNRCGWPVSERDVHMLEREIKQADVYLRQAKDLQRAGKDGGKSLAEKPEEKDGDDEDDEEEVDRASNASSKASSRHFEGLGEVMEKKVGKKEKTSSVTQQRVNRTLDTLRGQRVISKSEVDGFYYPGTVVRCPNVRTAIIEFEEIGEQTVPSKFVIPVTGAIARPRIMMSDYVLARVVNQDTGLECYVPAIVQAIPRRHEDQAKFFTLILYTGQKAHFLRTHLVKISKIRYSFLVRYIADVAHKKAKEEEDAMSKSSRSSSRGSSRSRSRSSSRSRSNSQRSRSNSRSRSRSRSRTSSKSRSVSRSRSRSPERSPRSPKRSKESRSRSNPKDRLEQEQHTKLKQWQKKLKKQQEEQEQRQKQLKKKARKLAKIRQKIKQSHGQEGDSRQLLEMILTEIENKGQRSARSAAGSQGRTEQWVNGHAATTVEIQKQADGLVIAAGDEAVKITTAQEDTSPFLMEMRHVLPNLPEGEEILARWSDEGWYYRGIIRHDCSDGSYLVEDSIGDLEKIWRENIIADGDDADTILQSKDAIIGLHPNYAFSYAPAVVLDVSSDLSMNVRFYDGVEDCIPRDEAYMIPAQKFEVDVMYILQGEEQLIGQAVVARNDITGAYQLGVVQERMASNRLYRIEWADGSNAQQSITYIFNPFTKRHPLSVGDRVLAIANPVELVYLPGKISDTNADRLRVKFCDGSVSNQVDPKQSFWLSADYYKNAQAYFNSRQDEDNE